MPVLNFREILVTDDTARRLLTAYFTERESGFAEHQTYAITPPRHEQFTPPAGSFIVLESDGDQVGCGGTRRITDGTSGSRFEIKHLWLDPRARGRGWGRLLLAKLEERASELGALTIVLDTHNSLRTAENLYRSGGYTSVEPFNDNPNANTWYSKAVTTVGANGHTA